MQGSQIGMRRLDFTCRMLQKERSRGFKSGKQGSKFSGVQKSINNFWVVLVVWAVNGIHQAMNFPSGYALWTLWTIYCLKVLGRIWC
jgi:hypothetical protein